MRAASPSHRSADGSGFQPPAIFARQSWGDATGWYRSGPLALKLEPAFNHVRPARMRGYGDAATFARMKRRAAPPMGTLSRTLSVVPSLTTMTVLPALKEFAMDGSSVPALWTS